MGDENHSWQEIDFHLTNRSQHFTVDSDTKLKQQQTLDKDFKSHSKLLFFFQKISSCVDVF